MTDSPLNPLELQQLVTKPEAGAVNCFIGTVREFTKGRRTLYLTYEAYEKMAEKKLAQIGSEIQEKWEETECAIAHRTGRLDISEAAVVIAVSSPHRQAAMEASSYAIERIKEIVPIWKKEQWEDGTAWIGDQLEKNRYPRGGPGKEELEE
ncbi:molybdenum cofactor biosynthesis protein MoaE [Alkalicoccus urumqiensis]|uniref:molybdenum cofactor biosynthesis protein MoaE n=1 Tax=Alkalicoccus urumqiensis TaxID=1548213 RepID=UPI003CC98538